MGHGTGRNTERDDTEREDTDMAQTDMKHKEMTCIFLWPESMAPANEGREGGGEMQWVNAKGSES